MPRTTQRRTPAGYVDMAEARRVTGLSREWITKAAGKGQIPGAIHRGRRSPWYFTLAGLRKWIGITDEDSAA